MTKSVNAKSWTLLPHPDGTVRSYAPPNQAPVWSGVPAPSFTVGVASSYSLLGLVTDPEGDAITFSSVGTALPSGVTINNTTKDLVYDGVGAAASVTGVQLRATATGGANNSSTFSFSVAPASGSDVTLTTFSLLTPTAGTSVPFTIGHPFKQGDVPAGFHVAADVPEFQSAPQTYWPDGSLKHSILSGRRNMAPNVTGTITLRRTTTAPPGGALTTAQLAAAMPTVTITGGAHTTTLNSLLASPQRTVVAGPQMSNWIYREAVAGSSHLVVWVDVRFYAGGAIEIFPWVENAYTLVAAPVNDVRTWGVTINGVSRFSQSIDIKYRTRIPLVTGTTFSYWVGTDPGIVPAHDGAYLRSTKLIPNYRAAAPSSSRLAQLLQTYTPNTTASVNSQMGTAGSSAAILQSEHAIYVTTGDARAWRASLVHELSGGSWSSHYRDENTNEPLNFQNFPLASVNTPNTPVIPAASGGTNGTHVLSHQPSYGYFGWMLAGRWFYLDEMQFWSGWNFLFQTQTNRENANGIIKSNAGANTDRGAAWGYRTLCQALALMPANHPNRAAFVTSVEANITHYYETLITGTREGGIWTNNSAGIAPYYGTFGQSVYGASNSPPVAYIAGWMQNMFVGAVGYSSDLGLPISSTANTRLVAWRTHMYKLPVNLAGGDGSASNWNWRRFAVYSFPVLNNSVFYAHFGLAHSDAETGWGLAALPTTAGATLKQHTSNNDLVDGTSTQPYFGQALTALSYAVDHGAPNAAAGYARITGSSSFAGLMAANSGMANEAVYAVEPRVAVGLPSWVPAPGTFANIGTSTLNAVKPSGWPTNDVGGPFANWSGADFAPDFGARGGYVIHGSGHLSAGSPIWAGVWVFDLDTLTWVGRNVPSQPLLENAQYNGFYESTNPATAGHTYAPHTYDGLVVRPAALGGGPAGSLLRFCMAGSGISGARVVHQFDLSSPTAPPTRVIDNLAGISNSYPMTAVDTSRGGVWCLSNNGNGQLSFVNLTTLGVTAYTNSYNEYGDHSMVYLPPPYDALVGMGRSGSGGVNWGIWVMQCSNIAAGWTNVSSRVSGSGPADRRAGGVWSTILNCIVSYTAGGSTAVHRLTPPAAGSLTTGNWAWTSETLTGVSGAVPARNSGTDNGSWGRFLEVPALRCFIWTDGVNNRTQAWRLNGM